VKNLVVLKLIGGEGKERDDTFKGLPRNVISQVSFQVLRGIPIDPKGEKRYFFVRESPLTLALALRKSIVFL
jgi:hypothetical protein